MSGPSGSNTSGSATCKLMTLGKRLNPSEPQFLIRAMGLITTSTWWACGEDETRGPRGALGTWCTLAAVNVFNLAEGRVRAP